MKPEDKHEIPTVISFQGTLEDGRCEAQTATPTKQGSMASYFVICSFKIRFLLLLTGYVCLGMSMCAQVLSETTGVLSPGAAAAAVVSCQAMNTGN